MNKTKIIPLITLLLLFSCGSEEEQNPASSQPPLQVEGFVAKKDSFNNTVTTTANILANEQVELKAPISGQVLKINFKEGAKIRKNQSLIQLDDRGWKAELIGLKAALEISEKDYERKKSLLDVGGSSEQEVEKLFSSIQGLKSQIQQLNIKIDLANINAPFSGIIGMRDFSQGAYLKEGDLISVLTEMGKLKVDFSLASRYINSIKIDQTIKVLVSGDTLDAKIYAINPTVNSNSKTINIRAMLEQPENKIILPGVYAEVLVKTDFSDEALLIPTQAVVPEINDQTVYLYKSGKAERRTVETGNRTDTKVQIISGISPNDTIITTGLLQIRTGMDVELQSISK